MIKNLILLISDGEKFRMLSKSKAKKENKMCMFSRNAFKIEQHSQKFWKKIKQRYTQFYSGNQLKLELASLISIIIKVESLEMFGTRIRISIKSS